MKMNTIRIAIIYTGIFWLTAAIAATSIVDLGSAAHFAILAGSAITGGGGVVNGDVGLSPTTGAAITGSGLNTNQVHGIIYAVDIAGPAGSVSNSVLLTTAKDDLTTAYTNAEGRSVDRITMSGDIGGQTLTNGLYRSSSTLGITGDLTLDAQSDSNAVWIFQIGSTLTTASGSTVTLTNGAQARNIFWQVGSSATLGTDSVFKGTLLALTTITMNIGCMVEGRALAQNGAVTFSGILIGLPTPEPPIFTYISRTTSSSATVILSTTPYFPLTLKYCPDLLLTNWITLATETPVTTLWTFVDNTASAIVTNRFYRAFITY